jgi:hypothetical protein
MNCQQHDLAIVVDNRSDNDGRTCTCLRFVGTHAEITDRYTDLWHVDRPMTWIIDGVVAELPYAPDQFLRRICPGVDGKIATEERGAAEQLSH